MSLDNRFMEIRMGTQLYGVPLMAVKEVIQKPEITSVPNMPKHFEGMINLRGQILGVFNIKSKLSKGEVEAEQPPVIVVVEDNGVLVGMIVDEVTRVLDVDPDALKAAPLKGNDPAAKFISGIIHSDEELVMTLKIAELLELNNYKQKMAA